LDFCIGSDYDFIKLLPSVGCKVVHNDQNSLHRPSSKSSLLPGNSRPSYLQVIRAQGYSVMLPESAKHHGLALIADNMLEGDTILPQTGSSSQF